ncbi:MAG: succinylglutamate desuccinylase/aspartoacylase family protein [Gammaproteobacteria bacterium]|nr:succinylglutamate desuccinylase/aspartoacylase family protein [Gammaproteobacteria bacterium]
MSFERICKTLVGDAPGRSTELNYYRVGPDAPGKKVYLQGAIHADEQPGILVLHHLLALLRAADSAGELEAEFVVLPMVNPLGMGDIEFGKHQGRYNRASGVNYNRGWLELYDLLEPNFADTLADDAGENVARVRAALRLGAAALPENTAFEQWQKTLISEACDADYVFDLHCDDDALMYIYSLPQMRDDIQQLADWTGAAATLLAEEGGGNSFDEVWPAVWLRLARENPQRPLPLPLLSCTLEYRGQIDTFDELNQRDARNLFGFFQQRGLIGGQPIGSRGSAAAATDLRATEFVRAPGAGLVAFCIELGDRVERGERIADLLLLDGDGAFVERRPILAGTSGLVLSRTVNKYVWSNANVAKIVGEEILESRSGNLLSD